MTRRNTALIAALALAAGSGLSPSVADAQCRLCDTPTTAPESADSGDSVSLQIEAALDFDSLVLLGGGDGTAALLPDGSRQVSGMVGAISSRAMVGGATVRGEPGRAVRIDLPRRIELHSLSGGQVVMDEIVSDLPAEPKLNASGQLSFRFGGRLRVSGDSEGEYRGDIPITVEYL